MEIISHNPNMYKSIISLHLAKYFQSFRVSCWSSLINRSKKTQLSSSVVADVGPLMDYQWVIIDKLQVARDFVWHLVGTIVSGGKGGKRGQ